MKTKKYRLEREILENLYGTLKDLSTRSKLLMSFIAEENISDQYYYDLLSLYYNNIFNYMREIEKLVMLEGKYYLIGQDLLDKLNNYKKIITGIEEEVNKSPRYSLRVH